MRPAAPGRPGAAPRPFGAARPVFGRPLVGLAAAGIYHLLSFEVAFALYLYSNTLKPLLPPLPVNETLLLGALSLAAGLVVVLRQGISRRGLPIVGAGLLFMLWVALSWGWSPARWLASRTISYLLTFNLWCLIAGALLIAPSRERLRRLLAALLVLAVLIAGYGLHIELTHGSFRFYRGFGEEFSRAYLSWGYAAADGAIIAFALAIFSRALGPRQLLAAALLAVCGAFVLVGGGRGPLLGLVLAGLVAVAAGLPRLERRRILVPRWQLLGLALLLGAGAYVGYLLLSGVPLASFDRFAKALEQIEYRGLTGEASRAELYIAAFRLWLEAPLIGHGVASYPRLVAGFEAIAGYPHNIVLEVLAELGLVGLALLLLFFATGLRRIDYARLQRDPLLLCVVMLLALHLVAAMVKSNLAGQQQLFFTVGLLALRPHSAASAAASRA